MASRHSPRQQGVIFLLAVFFLVGCASSQSNIASTPTLTPTPSPTSTATPTPTPTRILPTPTPAGPPPTWSVSPTSFTLTNQNCPLLPNGMYFDCVMMIKYNSQGNHLDAQWLVIVPNEPNPYITVEPNSGTLTAPTSSAKVEILVLKTFCSGGPGSSVTARISWHPENFEPDQQVRLNCP